MERRTTRKPNNDSIFGNDTLIQILELHPSEMQLLHALRTRFKFGEVTIRTHNGLPFEWRRVTEMEKAFVPKSP